MTPEPIAVLLRITEHLRALGIEHVVGGSVASSVFGEPRSTADVDILAALGLRHVKPLIELTEAEFYVDEHSIHDAIRASSSFNLIHLETIHKVDIFVAGRGFLDREQLRRRRSVEVTTDPSRSVPVTAPENIVLRKLDWYRRSGGVSERQWRDVLGVLKVQQGSIDRVYLQEAAQEADLNTLLEQALLDAGLK